MFRRAPVRVGIVLSGFILPYMRATAVARLRVYDVIEIFATSREVAVELYFPERRYDAVIFEKTFDGRAYNMARILKQRGTKIILDSNVNYFSDSTPRVTPYVAERAHAMAGLADAIIVPSQQLAITLREMLKHRNIKYIPEPIPERYLHQPKVSFTPTPRLVWCGYHKKGYELESIAHELARVRDTYGAELTVISDKDPRPRIGPYQFLPYRERAIAQNLTLADVFIAPRVLDQAYKYHHTFSKIGLPMACGLPVIASPVPAYRNSPAILCNTMQDWQTAFDNLYTGNIDLVNLSQRGKEYCRKEFSWERVRTYYSELFQSLTQQPV